jgi:hypothetical protein
MKGLSFSELMVKAWLAGRKTVTRRLINPQPDGITTGTHEPFIYTSGIDTRKRIKPRYLPGEMVYIKEMWRVGAWDEHRSLVAVDYKADGYCRKEWLKVPPGGGFLPKFYPLWKQCTDDAEKAYGQQFQYEWAPGQSPCRFRSPRFMPEWASRSHALIVRVRPERIQSITEEEANREGVRINGTSSMGHVFTAREHFIALWESLHPRSWERNDWAWRIELEEK